MDWSLLRDFLRTADQRVAQLPPLKKDVAGEYSALGLNVYNRAHLYYLLAQLHLFERSFAEMKLADPDSLSAQLLGRSLERLLQELLDFVSEDVLSDTAGKEECPSLDESRPLSWPLLDAMVKETLSMYEHDSSKLRPLRDRLRLDDFWDSTPCESDKEEMLRRYVALTILMLVLAELAQEEVTEEVVPLWAYLMCATSYYANRLPLHIRLAQEW